jgi:tetratricopeptide (TPR) repeat protein
LVVGQNVISIGAPQGLELTLADGLISSLRPQAGSAIIQTTAPISHGSSGGGLFDSNGRLIGITTFQMVDGQNLNFALPVDWISQLKKGPRFSSANQEKGVNEFAKKMDQLFKNEDFRNALRLARAEVDRNPKDKLGWYYMGAALNNLGRSNEAVDAFEHALEIDSNFEMALRNEATAYMQLGRFNESESNLKKAVEIDMRDGLAWNLLALCQDKMQDYDSAIGSATMAVTIQPTNSRYLATLGTAYYQAQDFVNAATNLKAALSLNPMDHYSWTFLALTDSSLGRQEEMHLAFENAKRIKRGESPLPLASDGPPDLPPSH